MVFHVFHLSLLNQEHIDYFTLIYILTFFYIAISRPKNKS